jgi:hypothetical protein
VYSGGMTKLHRIALPHQADKLVVFPVHTRGFRIGHLIVGLQALEGMVLNPLTVRGLPFRFRGHNSDTANRANQYPGRAWIEWSHTNRGTICILVQTKKGWADGGVVDSKLVMFPDAEQAFDAWLARRRLGWGISVIRQTAFEAHWGSGYLGQEPI